MLVSGHKFQLSYFFSKRYIGGSGCPTNNKPIHDRYDKLDGIKKLSLSSLIVLVNTLE